MNEAQLFRLVEPALPGKVFLMLAPMEAREPYVILSLVSGTPSLTLCGDAKATQLDYQIDSYARTYGDALEVMQRIADIVDGCDGDPIIKNSQNLFEPDTRIHRVSVVVSTWSQPEEVQS
ncbi:DUF3168 domain-containing protein [Paraburkholderia sp. EG287A]|uniref:tail completion protein gp17 n=1 Tax=unclassified Paraburkholderia TaxID=2615204 RepID=UPI0034D28824